jgi:8-hydroxy-5-deazaflavin:NADPH oxidoreductase
VRIGVFGTGMVGNAIATKLVELGHDVMMGSRTPDNEKAAEWVASAGAGASQGTFADAAAHGELLFNCSGGLVSIEAIGTARTEDLEGKTLVDVANALDRSSGGPTVLVSPTDSLAEQIQRAFPGARVVKALNTMNCLVMVEPERVPGEHNVFVCGDDEAAKTEVVDLLRSFGWPSERILDLGDLSAARGTEAYVALWIRLWGVVGSGDFNVQLVR